MTCEQDEIIRLKTLQYGRSELDVSKTCLKRPLKKKIGFQDRLSLNPGQKYCRMLQGDILQYFRPSFNYHLSLFKSFVLSVFEWPLKTGFTFTI